MARADGRVEILDALTGEEVFQFSAHAGPVYIVAFKPNSQLLATGGSDETVKIWHAKSDYELAMDFLQKSKDLETTKRQDEEYQQIEKAKVEAKASKRLRLLVAALTTILILTVGIAFYLWNQKNIAVARGFASKATKAKVHRPLHGILLALKAKSVYAGQEIRAEEALQRTIHTSLARDVLEGHNDKVKRVRFNSDEDILATISDDGSARLWNVKSGKTIHTFDNGKKHDPNALQDSFTEIDFSPDGKILATASTDGSSKIWEIATGKEIHILSSQVMPPSVVKKENGSDEYVKEKSELSLAFTLDGQSLATGNADGTTRIWDVKTGKLKKKFLGHSGGVTSVAFDESGAYLVTTSPDNTANLWEVESESGKPFFTFTCDPNGPHPLAGFSPRKNQLFLIGMGKGSNNINIHIYKSLVNGKTLEPELTHLLKGPTRPILSYSFSPGGKYLSAAEETGKIWLWDVENGATDHVFGDHLDRVNDLAFSPDGRQLASVSDDKTVRLWDVFSGKILHVLKGHHKVINSVDFNADGSLLATGSSDNTTIIWENIYKTHLYTSRNISGSYPFSGSLKGDRFAFINNDFKFEIWKLGSRPIRIPVDLTYGEVTSLGISPDGEFLVAGHDSGRVEVWEIQSQRLIRHIEDNNAGVTTIIFGETKNDFVTTDWEGGIYLYKYEADGEWTMQIFSPDQDVARISSAALSSNGEYLAVDVSGGPLEIFNEETKLLGGSPIVWNVSTGKLKCKLNLKSDPSNPVQKISFSPISSDYLATVHPKSVAIWNISSCDNQKYITMESTSAIQDFVFFLDGTRFATGHEDGSTVLWDFETGKELYSLPKHQGFVEKLTLLDEGKSLASISRRGYLLEFPVFVDHLMATAKDRLARVLTTRECLDFKRMNNFIPDLCKGRMPRRK
jgi:WD40 repeat protein